MGGKFLQQPTINLLKKQKHMLKLLKKYSDKTELNVTPYQDWTKAVLTAKGYQRGTTSFLHTQGISEIACYCRKSNNKFEERISLNCFVSVTEFFEAKYMLNN